MPAHQSHYHLGLQVDSANLAELHIAQEEVIAGLRTRVDGLQPKVDVAASAAELQSLHDQVEVSPCKPGTQRPVQIYAYVKKCADDVNGASDDGAKGMIHEVLSLRIQTPQKQDQHIPTLHLHKDCSSKTHLQVS